jgi:ADP-heptose:LPS heptosyltransferase
MAPALDAAGVRRIAVFRALMLGDLLCAVPALRALRAAFPDAGITLVSLPWAEELARRLTVVDRFVAFPGFPGLPERAPDHAALPSFLARMQRDRYDLAVQLHGSGQVVNPLVVAFGARHTAGFAVPGQYVPEPALFARWPDVGHEIERLLTLTDHLGLPRRGTHLEFPLTAAELAWRDALVTPGRYACIHPGAQLPSRRWPLDRYAQVADALARRGLQVVVTGTAHESALAAALTQRMRASPLDCTGRTTLGRFGALVQGAALVVANDTGISHVAAALATPSVIVSCGADPARWAPLDRARHRVLAAPAPCRPCAHRTCPTQHECATGTTVDAVLACIDGLPVRCASQREPAHA